MEHRYVNMRTTNHEMTYDIETGSGRLGDLVQSCLIISVMDMKRPLEHPLIKDASGLRRPGIVADITEVVLSVLEALEKKLNF